MAATPPGPDTRQLTNATLAAALVAALVLVTCVLPAEYGVDPTGVGAALGFTRLSAHVDDAPDVTVARGNASTNGTAITYAFDARWTLREDRVLDRTGVTRELSTTRVPVTVNQSNVTRVTAHLAWVDDPASAPDELEVSVRAPDGRTSQLVAAENGADGRGNVTSTLQWRSVPYPDPDHPDGVLFPRAADDSARGEWTVHVRVYDAGDHANGTVDTGNAWNLTVTVESFALDTRVSEGEGGWDTVTIRLRPGESVEYKVHAEAGASFEYAWASTRPAYTDFHAEPDADPEDFTQYRVDVLTEDAGAHTAEFKGRHGWYWKNDEAHPVTITLRTRGEYTIVGVV